MNNEHDILVCIYADIFSNIEHIKTSTLRIQQINTAIQNLNNNYFDNECDNLLLKEYLNMFNDDNFNNEMIDKLKNLKNYIKNKINNKCEHEWVNDTIDIDPDRSEEICYCVKCEVTKK